MTISIIVAMDSNQTIGNDGKLPWFLPEDLKYFRKKTLGKTIIMGRKTFRSLPGVLKDRRYVVISRDKVLKQIHEGTVFSLEEAIQLAQEADEEVMVIGGGEIFHQFYPHVDRLYVTHIDHDFEGETQWTGFKWSDWRLVHNEKGPKNEENPYDYWFSVYERGGNTDAPRLR
jgi:dihydrofolate reductase